MLPLNYVEIQLEYANLAELINLSYLHLGISVSEKDVSEWTESIVYRSDLWTGVYFEGKLIGAVISDFDSDIKEGIVEWVQILPDHRRRGLALCALCENLKMMQNSASFATVSCEIGNITNPERLYRKAGFHGNDIWHIVSENSYK